MVLKVNLKAENGEFFFLFSLRFSTVNKNLKKFKKLQILFQLVLIWKDSFLKWDAQQYENVTQLILKSSVICKYYFYFTYN